MLAWRQKFGGPNPIRAFLKDLSTATNQILRPTARRLKKQKPDTSAGVAAKFKCLDDCKVEMSV